MTTRRGLAPRGFRLYLWTTLALGGTLLCTGWLPLYARIVTLACLIFTALLIGMDLEQRNPSTTDTKENHP